VLKDGPFYKKRAIRMQNGISDVRQWNKIEYDFSISNASDKSRIEDLL